MRITINLDPETEVAVRAQAAVRGIPVADYVQSLVEQTHAGIERPRFSLEEFERDMDLLSEGTEGLPVLPDEALSREAMHSDHD